MTLAFAYNSAGARPYEPGLDDAAQLLDKVVAVHVWPCKCLHECRIATTGAGGRDGATVSANGALIPLWVEGD